MSSGETVQYIIQNVRYYSRTVDTSKPEIKKKERLKTDNLYQRAAA